MSPPHRARSESKYVCSRNRKSNKFIHSGITTRNKRHRHQHHTNQTWGKLTAIMTGSWVMPSHYGAWACSPTTYNPNAILPISKHGPLTTSTFMDWVVAQLTSHTPVPTNAIGRYQTRERTRHSRILRPHPGTRMDIRELYLVEFWASGQTPP